jgi:hypothetical protein
MAGPCSPLQHGAERACIRVTMEATNVAALSRGLREIAVSDTALPITHPRAWLEGAPFEE